MPVYLFTYLLKAKLETYLFRPEHVEFDNRHNICIDADIKECVKLVVFVNIKLTAKLKIS